MPVRWHHNDPPEETRRKMEERMRDLLTKMALVDRLEHPYCRIRRLRENVGFVYLIQARNAEGPVKIGYSRQPQRRLETMQTASPFKLHLVGQVIGSPQTEKMVHGLLRDHWLRGEWFRPHGDVFGTFEFLSEKFGHLTIALNAPDRCQCCWHCLVPTREEVFCKRCWIARHDWMGSELIAREEAFPG